MNTPQDEVRDCLVAVVTSDEDLHRFTADGIYKIPARVLGRGLSKRTLDESQSIALYQSGSITSGLHGAIEFVGDVSDVTLTTRSVIVPSDPTHPSSNELYYMLQLKDVHRLSRPIFSRQRRRIMFLRTSRARLEAAADVSDLIIGSRVQERLWKSLREEPSIVAERKMYMRVGEEITELDFALFRSGKALGIICDDDPNPAETDPQLIHNVWRVMRFTRGQLDEDFATCVESIRMAIEQLGTQEL